MVIVVDNYVNRILSLVKNIYREMDNKAVPMYIL